MKPPGWTAVRWFASNQAFAAVLAGGLTLVAKLRPIMKSTLPGPLLALYQRCGSLYYGALRAFIRAYAAHHMRRGSPGRVYRIPGRDCQMWLPIFLGKTVAQRRFGMYEPWSYTVCNRIAKPGMTVIELGACYGAFTIHLSRLVGPTGWVYAFEPLPRYLSILRRNVALNQLHNVECLNQAIAPPGTEIVYFDRDATSPYGSLGKISGYQYPTQSVVPGASKERRDAVPCTTLRNFIASRSISVDLLFMDVEGCEVGVLADIEPFLGVGETQPIVYMETHAQFCGALDLERMHSLFTDRGYSIEVIGRHWLCIPPADETVCE